MGYDVHLHRADSWTQSAAVPISRDEWHRVVASDQELRPERDSPDTVLWTGPCRYPDGTWFFWQEGRVFTKNPDRAILAKLLQLAQRLGARVEGDDGTFYSRPYDLPEETAGDLSPPVETSADLTPEQAQRLREANESPGDVWGILSYIAVGFFVLIWIARILSLFNR